MLSICQTIHSDASQYRVNNNMFTICHLQQESLKGKGRFVNGWFVNILPPVKFPSLPCSHAPSLPRSIHPPLASSLPAFPRAVHAPFRHFLSPSLPPSLPPTTSLHPTTSLPPSHPPLASSFPPSILPRSYHAPSLFDCLPPSNSM